MTSADPNPANFCYRHPDRQSFILCQRCGRTICTSCQTQAAVGVHCPECVREARGSAPKTKSRARMAFSRSSSAPVVTYSIIGLTAVVFLLQLLTGGSFNNASTGSVGQSLLYYPPLTTFEPWRMLTAAFVHGNFLHILFNMYSLFIFGPVLESMLGRGRFIVLYLMAAFGGSLAVLVLAPLTPVVGASGAIYGLMAAFFVIQRRLGGNSSQLLIVIGLNLVAGFFISGISWQAHVGGLIVGGIAAFVLVRTRGPRQRLAQIGLLAALGALLIAATVVAFSAAFRL